MGLKVPRNALRLVVLLLFIAAAVAQDDNATSLNSSFLTNSTEEYGEDPYLKYRPAFARSLPVQILLTGVVLTLVAVLFIHLIFTAQYHWPLAPVNYSQHWPYMLSYVAVNVPPSDSDTTTNGWSLAEKATWFVMNASTSGLIQITHIQFLTLLYPSRIEGRLIFALLGPLAIVAAIMQLVPIGIGNDSKNITSAVRNVCNATLSLLFTAALFIWGLLVKRKDAWRTDGGTAAFGCGALALALVSTALNFLYVPREEEYMWLPGLMWAVVLWQSFLGWWWWVGAGTEFSLDEEELERMARRAEKRAMRKQEARQRRIDTKGSGQGIENPRPGHRLHPRTAPPSTSSSTLSSATSFAPLPIFLPTFMHQWYSALRHEHVAAARQQAAERVERIRELERTDAVRSGWRLGSFAWRIHRRQPDRRKMEQVEDEEVVEVPQPQPQPQSRPRGNWFWEWRLQDSTVY
ncbi:hypothetical protein C8F01DRAFT_1105137 [Mycena amicta]|nr:hypothetical protein C8F01DRAFT_1105137 [Mycena amicta]